MNKLRLALLALVAMLVACNGAPSSTAPRQEPHTYGLIPHPQAVGFVFIDGGGTESVQGPATPTGTATNQYLRACDAGSGAPFALCWQQIQPTDIAAAFTVSLGFATGSGNYEVGQTSTPTYNATPATNAGTVTGSTITDNQGCSGCPKSVSSANPLAAPSSGGTYDLSSPGTVTVTVAETQVASGTTASGSASLTYSQRAFYGMGASGSSCTALSVTATTNATITCSSSATLTGYLGSPSGFVGSSFTITPSGSQWALAAFPHWTSGTGSGGSHTFTSGGFPFNLVLVASSVTFSNYYSVSVPMDLYASTNALTVAYTVSVAN